MRKGFLRLLLVIGVLSTLIIILPITVSAATSGTCSENLTWTLDDNGTLTISGTGDMMDYQYKRPPWYSKKDIIKTIDIKYGVTNIGNYAFYQCDSIKAVTIPDSVTTIGNFAFYGCWCLTGVTIPNSVITIGNHAFYECLNLLDATIGNSVSSIGEYAFCSCESLTHIIIPDSVTSIGENAFCLCEDLNSITIPSSITCIESHTFTSCDRLRVVTIPDSVTTIKDSAFSFCYSLATVYYSGNNEEWQKISIGSYNEWLTNANIYYSDWPVNIRSAVCYLNGTELRAEVTLGNITQNGILVLAIYDKGKLKALKTHSLGTEAFIILLELDTDEICNGYEAKVFVWEDISLLKPLSEPYTTEITVMDVL